MKKISLLLVLLSSFSYGQKTRAIANESAAIDLIHCRADFNTALAESIPDGNIEAYLHSHFKNLHTDGVSIRLMEDIQSLTGRHLLFQQYYHNTIVYRGQIKVNLDLKGNIISVFDNSFVIETPISESFPSPNTSATFIATQGTNELVKTENTFFYHENALIPSSRIDLLNGRFHSETFLDQNGKVIYRNDLNSYHHAPSGSDSTVSALVFLPDPLTTAGVTYGSPYKDSNDVDVAVLNAQRMNISMKVDFNNDTFRLMGPFAMVKEFDNPVTVPAFCKTTANFNYTRAQPEFEDVNSFYHITTFHNYIASLGFSNIVNYQIRIDAHAMGGADNSMFSAGFSPPRLFYGEGGVDDAEDQDVIIHEYGHAISFSAAPNTNTGTQRQTLDEANGDYLAASYSRFLNPFKWDYVFSWDGHNEFWTGRSVLSSKLYPTDLVNNIYTDAEIWAATLMQIWGDIGRQNTDKILIESMYGYSIGMTMSMAAQLYIKADSTLNNGANYVFICNRFLNRGLVSSCASSVKENSKSDLVYLINSANFSKGESLEIIFPSPSSGNIEVFNMEGKVVFRESISKLKSYELSSKALAPGVYLLNVPSPSGISHFKLLKF